MVPCMEPYPQPSSMSLHFPLLNGDNKDDASNNMLLVMSVLASSQILGDFKNDNL